MLREQAKPDYSAAVPALYSSFDERYSVINKQVFVMQPSAEVNPARKESERVYDPSPVLRDDLAEGPIARILEQQTAKIPSDIFLFAALGMMGLSTFLSLSGRDVGGRLLGMWAPALLTMGLYNKLVKLLRPR